MAYIDKCKVKEHENLTDEIGSDLLQIDKEYTGGSKVWLDVEFFHKLTKHFCLSNHLVKCLKILLDKQPTADVQEVKHGKWIDVFVREVYISDEKTTIALTEQKCSCCNVVTTFKGDKQYLPDFNCPNCGAKMNGKEMVGEE